MTTRGILAIIGVVMIALGVIVFNSIFIVHQTEQAIVLQLGNPQPGIRKPGLRWKAPFVQNVVKYEKRVLNLDPQPQEMILVDQKRILVDAFARYRIVDPLKFYQSARNERTFVDLFGRVLNSSVRAEVARTNLGELLSEQRSSIMRNIFNAVSERGANYGIQVVDVRIGRTELPGDVLSDAYERMRSEREREANLLRAEGEETSLRIRAASDRERTVIIAEAERQSSIERGIGDAARNRILGESYSRDREFFDFYRSLEAYQKTFTNTETTLLLSPDSEFFRYFRDTKFRDMADK